MKKALIALSALLVAVVSCNKTADLENKINDLDKRVSVLEEKVKEINEKTVPGLQATVAAVQAGVTVTSVVKDPSGYTITFSNGTTAVITNGQDGKDGENGKDGVKGDKGENPVISAKMDNGEFYWTVDGEFLLDAEGNKIPVHAATPQFRINEGKWEISYDGGATWTVVEKMGTAETGSISIEDKEDVVIFWIGETPYTVQKESTFCLVIDGTKDIGVPAGAVISIPYTVKGAKDGDEVEVEIFNVLGEWEATITRTSNVAGTIKAAPKGETVTDGKVFVYAANGNGKTDIKCLYFEEGKLSVITDAEKFEIPAEGGEFAIAVETNMSYSIEATNGGTKWISLAPSTKATHVDSVKFIVKPNTGAAARSSQISIVHPVTEEAIYTVDILQAGTAGLGTKYEDYLGTWMVGTSQVTISEKVKDSTYVVKGFAPIAATYGESVVEALYDKATGNFSIMEQKVAEAPVGSYGTCYFFLTGLFSLSKVYPHYYAPNGNADDPAVLMYGNLTENGIECVAGMSEYGVAFIGYAVRWIIQEGANAGAGNYAFNSATAANLPLTFEKPKPASDEYKAFLGQWVIPTASASFTITVEQNVANSSYVVKNWQKDGEGFVMQANFVPETKSMVLVVNSTVVLASGNVSSGGVSYPCNYAYRGYIQKTEGGSYSSVQTGASGSEAAVFTMNADGTATIAGLEVELSDGTKYPYKRIGLAASSTDGSNKLFTLSGYCQDFPLTVSHPAAGSSTNSVNEANFVAEAVEETACVAATTNAVAAFFETLR